MSISIPVLSHYHPYSIILNHIKNIKPRVDVLLWEWSNLDRPAPPVRQPVSGGNRGIITKRRDNGTISATLYSLVNVYITMVNIRKLLNMAHIEIVDPAPSGTETYVLFAVVGTLFWQTGRF